MASPFGFRRFGQSGIEVSEIFPRVGAAIDDFCVVRSCYADNGNHGPSLMLMNTGHQLAGRPSMGSWITYGLGTENQNLPGFVALCPGYPVMGPRLWSSGFLPNIYQGTYVPNNERTPDKLILNIRNTTLGREEQEQQLQSDGSAEPALSGTSGHAGEIAGRSRSDGSCLSDADRSSRSLRCGERERVHARPLWRYRFRPGLPVGAAPCGTRRPNGRGLLRKLAAMGQSRRHPVSSRAGA